MKTLMVVILLTWVIFTDSAAASKERYCAIFQLCHHPPVFHSGFATVEEVELPVKNSSLLWGGMFTLSRC